MYTTEESANLIPALSWGQYAEITDHSIRDFGIDGVNDCIGSDTSLQHRRSAPVWNRIQHVKGMPIGGDTFLGHFD
jgi:hypothetical protein